MEVNNNDALNPFVLFPVGVNLDILSYISDADLIKRISLVCRQFKELSYASIQWEARAIRLWGRVKAEQSFSQTKNWKLSYMLGPNGYISVSKDGEGNFIGKRVHPNKIEETGEFQNYILIKGSRTHRDGTVYEGQFINDKLNGQGTINFCNRIVHEGEFKNDKLNGQGKKIFPDGTVYEGQYINDKLNGQGTISFLNRIVYEGEFKNDKLNGQGTINFRNGTVYTGHFINDKLNGPGKITHPNGIVDEGEFKNGELNIQAYGTKAKECSSRTC